MRIILWLKTPNPISKRRMAALSDAVVIGVVLTLVFSAVAYYLYSRMIQAENKLGLVETILLNLKMATEASLFMSMAEPAPQPAPMRIQRVEEVVEPTSMQDDIQKMINDAHSAVEQSGQQEEKEVEFASTAQHSQVPSQLMVVKDDDGNSKVHIGFESMSWKELCAEGKKRGVTGMSHMNRRKLIDILNKKEGITSTPKPQETSEPLTNWTAASVQEGEMVGTDLQSIHEFPENGAPLANE